MFRNIALACVVFSLAALTAFAGSAVSSALSVRSIEAESIVLRSPDGQHTITLSATNYGAGIWIQDKDQNGRSISIYNLEKHGTAVGLSAPGTRYGFRSALFIEGSEGRLQLSNGKTFRQLSTTPYFY